VTSILADYLLRKLGSLTSSLKTEEEVNMLSVFNSALQIFPKLTTGLDVNIKFHSIFDFEYSDSLAIFDMLSIQLAHGWVRSIYNNNYVY
jgi:hypothetical protein